MRTRYTMIVLVVVAALAAVALVASAGNPDSPPGPPDTTSSYTLEDIYTQLTTGATGIPITFTGPSEGPPTGTMHRLNEIMSVAPTVDDTNGATQTHIAAGSTAWGLTSGEWGPITGTLYGGCTCAGTLNGTRWCDNGDGTVTDLSTCLVWLQNASCNDNLAGINKSGGVLTWTNAVIWSSVVASGTCGLSDGSRDDDWWLPTKSQLYVLTHGDQQVRSGTPRAFTGVQATGYWSSSSYAGNAASAFYVSLFDGSADYHGKFNTHYVWPVRGGE